MSHASTPPTGAPESRISLLPLLTGFVRHLRLVVAFSVVTAVLGAGYGFLTRQFVAASAMMPQSTASAKSTVAGIAAQFGITVGGTDDGESLSFYAALLKSRRLLTDLAHTTFTFAKYPGARDTLSGTLIDLLKYTQDTPQGTDRYAFLDLQDRITVTSDFNSNLLTTTVQMPWPLLAEQVNRKTLEMLNDFNLTRRQSGSRAEREFSESRLVDAQRVLTTNEMAMQHFLDSNRSYQGSPRLQFEQSRLQRAIDEQQSVVTALRQSVEQARLDEVRDVPVITVVDPPEGGGRSARNPLIFALLMGFVGGFFGVCAVLVIEYYELERRERPDEVVGLRGALRSQWVWPPWRRKSA